MLRILISILFTFILAILSPIQGRAKDAQESKPNSETEQFVSPRLGTKESNSIPLVVLLNELDKKAYSVDCSIPPKVEDANYCEQKRSADTAQNALNVAYFQNIVASIGAVFSAFGIGFAAWAAVAASRAAKSAADAVRTERAYMTFTDSVFGEFIQGFSDNGRVDNGFISQIVWRNTGRSPAKLVYSDIQHRVVHKNDEIPRFDPDDAPTPSAMIVGPNVANPIATTVIGDQDANLLRGGHHKIYVYCLLKYTTVWSPELEFHTEVCFEIVRSGGTVVQDGVLTSGTFPRAVGPQNTFS